MGAYEDRLHAERAMQDRAIGSSRRILVDADAAQVQTRQVGATHWVALTTTVGTDDDGAEDPRWANSLVESLHTALSRAGNPPTGHWWTALEPTDSAHEVRVLLAWPVGAPVPAEFTIEGADVRTGTLPSRTEAFVQAELGAIDQDLLDDTPGGRLLHPAYLTFVEYLESHGHQPRHIRQTTILDDGGTPAALELAATMTHSG